MYEEIGSQLLKITISVCVVYYNTSIRLVREENFTGDLEIIDRSIYILCISLMMEFINYTLIWNLLK